ncbi:MAG: ATP-binding protein [Myxococcota bacterium]
MTQACLHAPTYGQGKGWQAPPSEWHSAERLRLQIADSVHHRVRQGDRIAVSCGPKAILYVVIEDDCSERTLLGLDALGRAGAGLLEQPTQVVFQDGALVHLLEQVIDSYPFGAIVVFDTDLRYQWVGGKDLERVGLDAQKMKGRLMDEVFPEAADQIRPAYVGALAGEVTQLEVAYGDQWYLTLNGPVREPGGRILAGITVTQNITELREARAALSLSEHMLNLAQEIGKAGSWSLDLQTQKMTWSTACARLHGYTSENAPKDFASFRESLSAEAFETIRSMVEQARHSDAPVQIEFQIEVDGCRRWLQSRCHRISNENQEHPVLVGMNTDITATKRVAQELQTAKERAESGERAKTRFLATMSHEMRTPLHGILGSASLLLTKDHPPDDRESLQTIQQSGEALLSVIDDVLDLSRLEHGEITLEQATFSVSDLLNGVLRIVAPRANEKRLHLLPSVPLTLPVWRTGDKGRVRQILLNLLGNAVKFTDAGEITAGVREVQGAPDMLEFWVQDTGPGIPEHAIKRLFKPFSQVDASTRRRFGGSGLGLSIVRRLSEAMDGEAWVKSRFGEGSTFWVRLRLPPAAAAPVAKPVIQTTDPGTLRVLVAEDNRINQRVISRMLKRLGHTVTITDNGRLALEAYQAQRFDLILMDMHMPEMDGLQATRAIRSLEAQEQRPRVQIWALTANAMESDQKACLEAGHDRFVTKPLSLDKLRESMSTVSA